MQYDNVLTEMDGDLLMVTLHWPERRNAMNHQMRVDLLDCVRQSDDFREGVEAFHEKRKPAFKGS